MRYAFLRNVIRNVLRLRIIQRRVGGRRRHQVLALCLTMWPDSCLTNVHADCEGSHGGGKGTLYMLMWDLREILAGQHRRCAVLASFAGHLQVAYSYAWGSMHLSFVHNGHINHLPSALQVILLRLSRGISDESLNSFLCFVEVEVTPATRHS